MLGAKKLILCSITLFFVLYSPRAICVELINAQPEANAVAQLQAACDWNDTRYLGKLLKQYLGKKVTLDQVRTIAREHNSEALLRAISATVGFFENKKDILGIKRGDFLQISLFIETSIQQLVQKRQFFMLPELTALEFPLEYDPNTGRCFIILPKSKQTYIGAGKNKVVMKAVLYNEKKPEIVARAVQTKLSNVEMKATNDLRGAAGIMDILACTTFKNNQEHYHTIYTKLYNPGSLAKAFDAKIRFTYFEKMKIALNILKGLSEMHKRHLVHRDVSPHNCLIHIPPGKAGRRDIVAVVADLGRADSMWKDYKLRSRVQGHSCYTPPEGIFKGRVRGQDHMKSDVYAVGCIFYQLFYGKAPAWLSNKYVANTTKPEYLRYRELASKIYRYTNARRNTLSRKIMKGRISTRDAFEHLILRMVDHDPSKRGSAAVLYSELQRILDAHSAPE